MGDAVKLYSLFPLVGGLSGAHRAQPQGPRASRPSPIHLQKEGGQNRKPEFRAINPQMRVPALKLDSGEVLTQSLAIIEYLDETHPQPPLLPRDPIDRAKVRALAQLIACDIHPLNNVAPLRYLKNELGQDQAKIDAWYHHWVIAGFDALEAHARARPLCLRRRRHARRHLPGAAGRQCAAAEGAARRYPKIVAVDAACAKLPAFEKARPENQPDAE